MFAKHIKKERARLGVSQRGLAKLLGMSCRTLQNWEISRRTPSQWVQKAVLETLRAKKA